MFNKKKENIIEINLDTYKRLLELDVDKSIRRKDFYDFANTICLIPAELLLNKEFFNYLMKLALKNAIAATIDFKIGDAKKTYPKERFFTSVVFRPFTWAVAHAHLAYDESVCDLFEDDIIYECEKLLDEAKSLNVEEDFTSLDKFFDSIKENVEKRKEEEKIKKNWSILKKD